jgi:hypothetical protein
MKFIDNSPYVLLEIFNVGGYNSLDIINNFWSTIRKIIAE